MSALKESIGTSAIRLNAVPGMCASVDMLLAVFVVINQRLTNSPDTVAVDLFNELPNESLEKIQAIITNTNNIKTRFAKMSDEVFGQNKSGLDEAETQIARAKHMTEEYMELMLTSQYSDDDGTICWASIMKRLTRILTDRAARGAPAGIGA